MTPMRPWILVVLLIAGCASGPSQSDRAPTGTPEPEWALPAPLATLSTLALTDCQAIEYDFLLDEAPPGEDQLPAGMTVALREGRMQVHGVTARCTLAGEPASFTLGAVRVNVTGPLQGPGEHGLLVRVAVDSQTLLDAFAAWGLWVAEQRAWTIELQDEGDRRFLHLDDPGDALAAPGVGNLLHLTRYESVSVGRTSDQVDLPVKQFRWFEALTEEGRMVVHLAVDEERSAGAGPGGPARVEDLAGQAAGTSFQGDGVILDGIAWRFAGRQLPAA